MNQVQPQPTLYIFFFSAQPTNMAQEEDRSSEGYAPVKAWWIKAKGGFEIVEIELTSYKDIQKHVKGYFEYYQIGKKEEINYAVYMCENGRRLNFPPNQNVKHLIPNFHATIFGDILICAVDQAGHKVDINVTKEELIEISSKFLK